MTTTEPNLPKPLAVVDDLTVMKLARELAKDIQPLEVILKFMALSPAQWDKINAMPHFQTVLRQECEAWAGASNTAERVKLKSLAFVEELLPEFYTRAHDTRELLSAKTEVLKTVARFAGVGATGGGDGGLSEKFSVTINLGADRTLKIEKNLPTQVIDGTSVEV